MDVITGEVLTTEEISGDVSTTQEIDGYVALPNFTGAKTWQELTLKPFESFDNEEFYVDENGVLHVNGGTSSNSIWYPNVSDNGDISWEKIESETAPTPKNIKGTKGDTGAQGIQGETGAQGVQGVKGDKGDTGENGVNGTNGADGKSAYEVAVLNGYVGTETEWLLSLKGEQGEQGIQGIQGIQGVQGVRGETGATGSAGADGINGSNGTDGKSAYQSALDGGFTGTESEFNTKIATSEQNVQSDWNVTDDTSDAFIKNKPTIPKAYTLPQATETTLGGIKAKARTTETGECAIDTETGKLYVPASGGSGSITVDTLFSGSSTGANILLSALDDYFLISVSLLVTTDQICVIKFEKNDITNLTNGTRIWLGSDTSSSYGLYIQNSSGQLLINAQNSKYILKITGTKIS